VDGPARDSADPLLVVFKHYIALGLMDLLHYDLFCRLSGYPAQFIALDLFAIAHYLDNTGLAVYHGGDLDLFPPQDLLRGARHSGLDRLKEKLFVYTLFTLYVVQYVQQL